MLFRRCTVVVAFVVFMLYPASRAMAESGAPRERVVVAHWGQAKILLYLPLYVAMERGFFARRGLDVSLKYSGNDDQVFASVVSGVADVGIGDPVFAAIARQRGFPGKVVGLLVVKIGLSGYTDRPDLPSIMSSEQLAGLRIGSFPAPSTTFTLLGDLERDVSRTHKGFTIVQLAIGAQAAGLASGEVDIATDLEPAVSIAEDSGKHVVFSLDRFTPGLAITGLTTTEAILHSRLEVMQKMVQALDEALLLLSEHPEVGIEVAKEIFPSLSPKVCETAVTRMMRLGVYPRSTHVDPVLWERSLSLRRRSGDLKGDGEDRTLFDWSPSLKAARKGDGQ